MELLFYWHLYAIKPMVDVNYSFIDLIHDDRYLSYDNDLAYYLLLLIVFMVFSTDIYPFKLNDLTGYDLKNCFDFYYYVLSFLFILIICFRPDIFYQSGKVSWDFFAIELISFYPSYS